MALRNSLFKKITFEKEIRNNEIIFVHVNSVYSNVILYDLIRTHSVKRGYINVKSTHTEDRREKPTVELRLKLK